MSPEAAALIAEGAALDQPAAPPPGAAPGAPEATAAPSEAEQLGALLQSAALMFSPALPYLSAIYTPQKCAEIGGALALVFKKYGWTLAELLWRYGPEIALAAAVLPTLPPAIDAHRKLAAARKAPKPSPPAPASASPGEQEKASPEDVLR